MITILTCAYALQKLDVILSKKDVDILSTLKEGFFEADYVFSYKNKLNIAAAFTAYDAFETEWELDPAYGSLNINSYSWGEREDGSYFTERKQLKTHICSAAELGL